MKSSLNDMVEIFHPFTCRPFTNTQRFGSQNGMEKPFFKLAPLGHELPFLNLLLWVCAFLAFLMIYCDKSSSRQPSGSEPRGLRVMAALSPPRPFAVWRVEALLFAVSLFSVGCGVRDLSGSMPDNTRPSAS